MSVAGLTCLAGQDARQRVPAIIFMRFEFTSPNKIIFGEGTLCGAGAIARAFGKRALVVTGRDAKRAGPLLKILGEAGVGAATFSVAGEPELSTIEQGTALAKKENCELVIGFGGGSAIGRRRKPWPRMLANDGELLDYVEIIGRGKALTRPSAPFIAIPTTAGTGSEVTRNAVLASPEHKLKVSLRSPLMLAKVALVDPELTYNLPPAPTASTGLDALTQLIEPFVCSRANPMTDGLCVEGIRRTARSLRVAFGDGQNQLGARGHGAGRFVRRAGAGQRGFGRGAWLRRADWREFSRAARRDLRGAIAARDGREHPCASATRLRQRGVAAL